MKALTIWQPWATLVILGAKPWEFRRYAARQAVGERIVIHAGARQCKVDEVAKLIQQISNRDDDPTMMHADIALPILETVAEALLKKEQSLPHRAGLGTVTLGKPIKASEAFKHVVRDSDRIDHHIWGWPMLEPKPFDEPMPMKGKQGFWNWPDSS